MNSRRKKVRGAPEEQAAVDAQIERVRQMFGIPAGGLVRRSGGGQGLPPRARDLTSVSAIAAAVINRAAPVRRASINCRAAS